jgi:hypothetical protein
MSEYSSIKNTTPLSSIIPTLKSKLKWSSFNEGTTKISLTKYGGVHWSGKETICDSITFEIPFKKSYIFIALYDYKKGVIFHPFIPFGVETNPEWNKKIAQVYDAINKLLTEGD